MSAENISTRRLEAVLRALAADDDLRVPVAAAKHLPAGTKLADFIAEIWAWLKQFNAGNRSLSPNRIDSALTKEPAAKDCPPAARKRVEAALERTAREPKLSPVNEEDEPRFGPPRSTHSSPNKAIAGKWIGKKWRGDGFRRHRLALVRLAKDPERTLLQACMGNEAQALGLAQFKANWIGTGEQPAEVLQAFIDYADGRERGDAEVPAAKNGGGIKADKPTPAAKPAKRKYTRRQILTIADVNEQLATSARRFRAPEAPSSGLLAGGFKELEINYGRQTEHDARYSGDKIQSPCFSVSTRLFPPSKAKASRMRLLWNGETRTCAVILNDTHGLKMQQAHGTHRVICRSLPGLFGKPEIHFKAITAPKDYDLMFEAIGGGS